MTDTLSTTLPTVRKGFFSLSPLNQRRLRNFRRNSRAFWSLIIFIIVFGISLFAEFIANDKPIVVSYRGELHFPIFKDLFGIIKAILNPT